MTMRLLGMPGPVWSMVLWSAVGFLVVLERYATTARSPQSWLAEMVIDGAFIVALVVLRDRTPRWLLTVCVATQVALSMFAIATTGDPTDVVSAAIGLLIAVLYVSVWWPGGENWVWAGVGSIGLLGALAVGGTALDESSVWFAMTATMAAIAGGVGIVAGRGNQMIAQDPLTGLLNRMGMELYLATQPGAGRVVLPRTVVAIDIDGFKELNDSRGHAAGDTALREFAAQLRAGLRPDDIAVRTGGDEFILILPRTGLEGADTLLDRLRAQTDLRWSAGAVLWPADVDFGDVLSRADHLMYVDKARRRGARGA